MRRNVKACFVLIFITVVIAWWLCFLPKRSREPVCVPGSAPKKAAVLLGFISPVERRAFLTFESLREREVNQFELPYGLRSARQEAEKALTSVEYNHPIAWTKNTCRSCVVVGNGRQILNSGLGSVIDGFDVVIRLNQAPTAGFEQDVGSRTTLRLFYPESAKFPPGFSPAAEEHLVLMSFKPSDFHWLHSVMSGHEPPADSKFWQKVPRWWNFPAKRVRILDPYYFQVAGFRLLNVTGATYDKQRPSSGLLAVSLALHHCDRVAITGFGYPDSGDSSAWVHYFDAALLKDTSSVPHDFPKEKKVLQQLVKLGAIERLPNV
uniref:Sialyltransferase n=1 Tax=Chelonid alphaherpesvirus 5 TaxID=702736 RepID=A0A6B9RCD2_9ALPH|nr:sialyltransferase [Chelonid alphaherpesvirus 5]